MAMNEHRNREDADSEVEKFFSELGPKRYSHVDLEKITSNFSESNILGSGGYGVVYKGQFPNGVQVAVKVLRHKEVVEEIFMAEVSTMGNTYHRNLMKLKGYCFEPNMKALVYEYMESGSLDKILYKCGSSIEWGKLYHITIEIAKGLAYLHDGSDEQIIHYDIKAGNVVLDRHLSPKITDFGMAKLVKRNVSHVSLTRTRGTQGYNAPETWMPGSQVTCKCDVYSFGMMLFEVLGKRNNGEGEDWFPGHVWDNFKSGQLDHVLNYVGIAEENKENAKLLSMVALWCTQFNPEKRPTMREVVLMLEKTIRVRMPPNPFPFWQSSKSSVLPSLEVISEDDLKDSYGIDERTIQDAESFSFSLEDNIPGSTDIVSAEEESQVIFQPSTVEEGVGANVALSAFSVGVINPDGGLDSFANGELIYSNGDFYAGTWENGLRHGQGRFVWANGDVYIGEWKNDVQEGYGKFISKNGDFYEGTFRNSKRDGQGRFVWANGGEYSGEYINGVQEGHGIFSCEDGSYFEGTYKNDVKEGQGRYVFANGDEYNGKWENGRREGLGKFTYKNGGYDEGMYKNDVKDGKGRFVWANGDEYICEYINGVREGHGKFTHRNGDFYEGTYKNAMNDGKGRFVWTNGDEFIGEWRDGFREGHAKFTHRNEESYDGTFTNGMSDGKGRFVWANGEYIGEWKNCFREGHGKFTHRNGNVYEGRYKNAITGGKGRFVWEDGDEYIGEWMNVIQQ